MRKILGDGDRDRRKKKEEKGKPGKEGNQGTHRESSITRQLEGSMFNLLAASRNLTS